MSAGDALRFGAVEKAFGASGKVLRGVEAEIPLSGLTFVVGQSGQGKSVLCRLAVGLLRPDAGEVFLLGQPVHRLSGHALQRLRAQAPYLVQGPALLDWLTVGENVALARKGASPAEIRAALEKVGLGDVADRHPPQLSPGVQKRAAIARALMLSPRYLLLDEPTTGLSRDAALRVDAVLRQLRSEGLGALVVSHDYRAVRELADRVLMISAGRTSFLGPAAEFFTSGDPEIQALVAPQRREPSDG
ncbi:MAG TPA: ATP-binding cassette domain-containing protein [Myxococcaceae bacterium]|nr:ATP-binding cassette domain-containing protein [Myxococcaceae bacterium]